MSPPDRNDIQRDVVRLLQNHPDEHPLPRELADRLGYESEHAYGRFRDVLDHMEAGDLVARSADLRYHLPGGAPEQASEQATPQASPQATPAAPAKASADAAYAETAADAKPVRGAAPVPTTETHEQPQDRNKAIGRLIVKPQGFGFVEVEGQEEDYFIREHNMATAMDGDLVLVGLAAPKRGHKGSGKRRECEVLDVVERRRTQVVGTFKKKGSFAVVHPDDQRILQNIYVAKSDFGSAENGEKVAVSIDRFDDAKASPEGHILRVLGSSEDPGVRVLSLAMSMDVKADFPGEVEQDAAGIATEISQQEIDRRKDLRDENIFTIDPADAKDFDDAVHIHRHDDGSYEVGVHIADVSHYVDPGEALDREALERATSVYLVDRTIPMLPEKLSNQVCSLRPREDKLAYSCLMQVDPHGEVMDYEIAETVIHSKQRLTYEKAQDYIDGGFPDDPMASDVVTANRLARTLTKKRMREGSVDFDTDELKVLMDEKGNPVEIVRKQRMESNRLIEELMLLANRTVARHVAEQQSRDGQSKRPFVYRVHPGPDGEKIRNLAEYVQVFGYELELDDGNVRSTELNRLLGAVRGTPEEPVITRAALQSMSKAVYQTDNIGHYGLGFPYYTHFTSPIRRYPDLIVHRLLKHYAGGGSPADTEDLGARLKHCSEKEREAQEAERESVKLKQVEYAQSHVGNTFDGVVTGVTKFGVFVELSELLVEGLVHVRDMDDYFEYDESTFTLTGERSGQTYHPGDTVTVQLAAANPEKREIDLLFE